MRINDFRKNHFFVLVIVLQIISAFSFSAIAQTDSNSIFKTEITPNRNLKVFDELWEKVNAKYFDANFNGVNWMEMRAVYRPKAENARSRTELLEVLKQMLAELKTSHLQVWQVVSEKRIERKLQTDIDRKRDLVELGYGFRVKIIEEKPIVVAVEPNSSAETNGVQIGWTLINAGNVPVSKQNIDFGEFYEGKNLSFKFADNQNEEQNLTLTVGLKIKKPLRTGRFLAGKLYYIKFDDFSSGIGEWLKTEIEKASGANEIIVDLRDNRGGFVNEVKRTLSPFFADDTEFGNFIERGGKIRESEIKGRKDKAFKGKVSVLIDEESYSGAEIFAQLMQETGRGKIIGTPTRGFVLNSIEIGLPEDFRASIAYRDYISPKGIRIESKGVKPDIEISPSREDIIASRDAVLTKILQNNK
jgi:carboxyl-terminal processing protease